MKILLILIGLVSLLIGIIGIVVPLLPTTPFLLLAAACFLKSSKPLYNWLTNHKVFGSFIVSYMHHRAISKKTKIFALILLWISILYSLIFIVSGIWLKGGLLLIAILVSLHILKLKTLAKTVENNSAALKDNKNL